MKYLLDFDGVLFDTQTLKAIMVGLHIEESLRSATLFDDIVTADPAFDIKKLLFDDAYRFLQEHALDCRVVSSYVSSNPHNNQDVSIQREYQETKIHLSGVSDLVGKEHVHVVGISKRDALVKLKQECDEANEMCVFVDDRLVYVEEARSLGILSVWMNRTGLKAEPEERHQIASFDELIEKIQLWKN